MLKKIVVAIAVIAVASGAFAATAGAGKAGARPASPAVGSKGKGGAKAKPVVYADYSKDADLGGWTWGDEAKGCGAAFAIKEGKGVVTVKPCDGGWGAGITLGNKVRPFINASGKTKVVVKMKASAGLKMTVSVDETGCGGKEKTDFTGLEGADGERWSVPEWQGTGATKEYSVKLADLKRDEGYGNPNGNKKLDLQGLGGMQLYFPGSQPAGEVAISSIRFE
jgi:hypothetical protein